MVRFLNSNNLYFVSNISLIMANFLIKKNGIKSMNDDAKWSFQLLQLNFKVNRSEYDIFKQCEELLCKVNMLGNDDVDEIITYPPQEIKECNWEFWGDIFRPAKDLVLDHWETIHKFSDIPKRLFYMI
jgi:hypothetical protein